MSLRPFTVGVAGPVLREEERAFLRDQRPLGLILFARNIESPDQVRRLTEAYRQAVDDASAWVLIDQEGGRVQRLGPPHWAARPAMARFGALYGRDPALAREALALNCRLIAAELIDLGIDVDCLPVLDLPQPDADPIIADRAFGPDPAMVADLGRVAVDALLAGGVLPVIKHIPGHGRATVDSHLALPDVATDSATLAARDFAPFAALADAPAAMTAHIRYTALDPTRCATLSPKAIRAIRTTIGFGGLLLTDDLSMKALTGPIATVAADALAAGCDILLHCNSDPEEMRAVAAACPDRLPDATAARLAAAEARRASPDGFATRAAEARLATLIG